MQTKEHRCLVTIPIILAQGYLIPCALIYDKNMPLWTGQTSGGERERERERKRENKGKIIGEETHL